ncbi:hypothetical protein NEDG_02123 [Nematocida displodere]|uniref:PDZ GRASP-type domain-containing protein n=1 Tax=Nematocida displodere TaxID=1805483 RepID=A0A177EDU6_9MICR|nr:hypothetical protein NEDG_01433 [Nematocida displodere]OAG32256.1 hypothetical protein NEDG_02123 [Nematocida displodere]
MGAAASTRIGYSLHIIKVSPKSPAHLAGLLPVFHYVIGVNGKPITSEEDIGGIAASWGEGALSLMVYDSRRAKTFSVELTRASSEKMGFSVKVHQGTMHPVTFKVVDIDYNSPALDARLQKDQDYIIAHGGGAFSSLFELETLIYKHRGAVLELLVFNLGSSMIRKVEITPTEDGAIGCDLGTGVLNEIPDTNEAIELEESCAASFSPHPATQMDAEATTPEGSALEQKLYQSLNEEISEEVPEEVPGEVVEETGTLPGASATPEQEDHITRILQMKPQTPEKTAYYETESTDSALFLAETSAPQNNPLNRQHMVQGPPTTIQSAHTNPVDGAETYSCPGQAVPVQDPALRYLCEEEAPEELGVLEDVSAKDEKSEELEDASYMFQDYYVPFILHPEHPEHPENPENPENPKNTANRANAETFQTDFPVAKRR